MLVQIVKRTGTIERVPRAFRPVVELDLTEHQRVVSVELEEIDPYSPSRMKRKTADWRWTAYVEHRL